jgi:ribosomal protein S18 acetylase RimI-like enzyme
VHDDEIRIAAPADRDAVVATVVAAFEQDPAFRYFFPDDDTYVAEAGAFAASLFDRRVGLGTVWVAGDAHATNLWVPPVDPSVAASEEPLPGVSPEAIARLDRYDDAVHPFLPPQPHWYLGIAATHPAHAGRRLGRALIEVGRDRAAADRVPAVLETTNADNVRLYERAGWTVLTEVPDAPLRTWVLVA